MTLRLLPCGEDAVLIELLPERVEPIPEPVEGPPEPVEGPPEPPYSFPEPVEGPSVLDVTSAVTRSVADRAPGFEAVVDVVPAAETVLVTVAEGWGIERLRSALAALSVEPGSGTSQSEAGVVEIEVRYDGPDLHEVARLTGLSVDEVVAAHTGSDWLVGFGGFAPGFAYLVGGDERLRVPRRDEPRTAVPAGAVGLAGEFSAVYPRSSPGGWQLIGQTDAVMWDVDRDPPALLTPGTRVRFVEVRG